MNFPSRRERRQQPIQNQNISYFLMILLSFNFIGIDGSDANLYSKFNNGLDLLSNLAENKMKTETSSAVDEIYKRSEKQLKNQFENVFADENQGKKDEEYEEYEDDDNNSDGDKNGGDKLQKIAEIEKLIEDLAPNYILSKNYRNESRQMFKSRKIDPKNEKRRRDAPPRVFQGDMVLPESTPFFVGRNIWPINSKNGGLLPNSAPTTDLFTTLNRRLRCPTRSNRKRSRSVSRLQKRFDSISMPVIDPKPIMNTAPSLYPGVMAKSPELAATADVIPKLNVGTANSPLKLDMNALSPASNSVVGAAPASIPLLSSDQLKGLENFIIQNSPRHAPEYNPATDSRPSTPVANGDLSGVSSNVSDILEKVLQELEAIRSAKVGNFTADGGPCNIAGIWNSEIVGVQFDISVNNTNCTNKLSVDVHKATTKKKDMLMDPSWICSGTALKSTGGPFYIAAMKKPDNMLGTFTGFCMICGGYDIVFGSWTFVNPCNNCTDVSLAIETKRDIFRRDLVAERKTKVTDDAKRANKDCLLTEKGEEMRLNGVGNDYKEGFSAETFYEYF